MTDPRLEAEIAAQPHAVVYATLVGEQLYGFDGPDSDPDLRAAHVLPVRDVVGLRAPRESIAYTAHRDGLDFEFLSHEIKKICLMLLKKNGAILEQIHSSLVVRTTPGHEELKEVSRGCLSRHMARHYLSHAEMQWSLHGSSPRVKPLLHTYRVLLTGTHLMRAGELETDLPRLGEIFGLGYVPGLVARRKEALTSAEAAFHEEEHRRLRGALEEAARRSPLPAQAPDGARDRLEDLLVRLRLGEA